MEVVLAYIDPGSGSLVIQVVIAGLVAAPIFFRHQIRRIMRSIRGQEASTEMQGASDDTAKGG